MRQRATLSTRTSAQETLRKGISSMKKIAVAISTVGLVAAGVLAAAPASAQTTIVGGGASFPSVFIQECAKDYNASQRDAVLQYNSTGSSGGLRGFARGDFAYGATEAPYASAANEPRFQWTYLPLVGGAITLPINLKGTNGKPIGNSIQLTQKNVTDIWKGAITTWNHPDILKTNSKIQKLIPATPITLAYRADGSGTSNVFLRYLNAWDPSAGWRIQTNFNTAFPGGKAPTNSISGPQNAGVMAAVAGKEGAIGYVDLGDALKQKASVARVQNALGEFVSPTAASAARNGNEQTNLVAQPFTGYNFQVQAKGAYPIYALSYGLASKSGTAPAKASSQFFRYMVDQCGPNRAAALGFVPVAGKLGTEARKVLANLS